MSANTYGAIGTVTTTSVDDHNNNTAQQQEQQQQDEQQQQHHHHQYPVEPRRWIALGCLCAVGGINSAQQMNFAALTEASKQFLDMNDTQLNWLVAVFYSAFLLLSFFSIAVCERYGLRFVLLVASILNTLSTLLKLIALRWWQGYWTVLLAQIVCALAQPLYMPLPPLLAVVWFGEDFRAIATSIAALCTALGTALGMMYAPFMVDTNATTQQFVQYLTVQAVASAIETCVNVLFVTEEPEHAPSAAAALRRKEAHKHHHSVTLLHRMRQMFYEVVALYRNTNQALCVVGGGIIVGALYSIPAVLCSILILFGISNNDCGLISGCIIIIGLIVGAAAGIYVDANKQYRRVLLISIIMGVVFLVLTCFVIAMWPDLVILVGVTTTFAGAPLLAAFGIAMDAAAAETFPTTEVLSSTAVVYSGSVVALITVNVAPVILGDYTGDAGKKRGMAIMGIFLIAMIAGWICLWKWDPQNPRMKFEQEQNAKQDAAEQIQGTTSANIATTEPLLSQA